MGTLSGFRPPQFSEDDAWLPVWLHCFNFDELETEGVKNDHITFEQRVEELQFLQKGVSIAESSREGGCSIGQLFISGTESSPFSYDQSLNNGIQFHLCLPSDDDSENTNQTTDARQSNFNYPFIVQPLEDSERLCHGDVKLNLFHDTGSAHWSPSMELKRHVSKTELLKHDENLHSVEMCIAASEALVINEVIESGSFEHSASASAILEASLQVKQARLEVWKDAFDDSTHVTSEIDNLSDLDDINMESAYEDAGIYLNELSGNELSVSRVKDTFNSDYDESVKHEKTIGAATICGTSFSDSHAHIKEGSINDGIRLREDLAAECLIGDTQKRVIGNSVCDLGADVGYRIHCSRIVDTNAELHLSVSAEQGDNAITAEKHLNEANVSSSPIMSFQGNDYSLPDKVEEQYKSRWFGGWTNNNEVKHTTVNNCIPKPFACETSFLSETPPDENSFVQNHIKGATIASQLSMPTENFYSRATADMLPSQDVRSSSTSLVDPLCSVVPCSISENICSSPARNYVDKVNPGHPDNTFECNKDNVKDISPSTNVLADGEKIGMPIADIEQSRNGVSRKSTSLKDYSKGSPSHSHLKNSFFMTSNIELTFQKNCEETVKAGAEVLNKENIELIQSHSRASNSSIDKDENPIRTAIPESKSQCPYNENLRPTLIQDKTQSAQKLRASKRVRFCEKEIKIPEKKKPRKVQTASKIYSSTRESKKSSNITPHIDSIAPRMDKEKKRLIFQNMEFLLTGFSQKKEKEIEGLIRKYGGTVLSQLPSTSLKEKKSSRLTPRALPIVLCLKKIQSFKFLYGCAVNAYVLKVNWLTDSIASGFVISPKKYTILPRHINRSHDKVYTALNYNTRSLVFNNLGVMLHGKTKYFTNIATIIKHGGGQVFKTLPRLVQALEAGRISIGIVVVHDESCTSRHLKHFALEQNIPMTSVQLIIKSLYVGRLIFSEEKNNTRSQPAIRLQRQQQDSMELSQEI